VYRCVGHGCVGLGVHCVVVGVDDLVECWLFVICVDLV